MIGDIVREELERTAVETAGDLARLSDELHRRSPAMRRDVRTRIEELRTRAGEARTEAERWLDEVRVPVREEREQIRQEVRKRADAFMEGVAALDKESRQILEEKSKEVPADLERIAREVEQQLAPRLNALENELKTARGDLRKRLGIEQPRPAEEEPCNTLAQSPEAFATDLALRMLDTPQGRMLAERAFRLMREGGERTAAHVQQLRQGNAAMQEKIASLESQIAELRKCIEGALQARAPQ